jgi:hypothetical protein
LRNILKVAVLALHVICAGKSYSCDIRELEHRMKKNTLTMCLVWAGFVLSFAMAGCGPSTTSVNEVRTESQSVNLESATSADVRIDFPAGELKVQNGTGNLMDASFRYNVDDWQPQVDYRENSDRAELVVSRQPGADRTAVRGELINEWKIQLSESVPIDLVIRTTTGNCQLELSELDLSSLTIETGTGATNVNLNGDWQHNVNVTIRGARIDLTVNLPTEMGVRVEMETGIASVTANGLIGDDNGYVNQAFGTAPYTLRLKLETAMGSVALVAQ